MLGIFEGDRIDVIAVLTDDSGWSDNAGICLAISGYPMPCRRAHPIVPVLSPVTCCESKISDVIGRVNVHLHDEAELVRLVCNSPEIKEIDLNPVKGAGSEPFNDIRCGRMFSHLQTFARLH